MPSGCRGQFCSRDLCGSGCSISSHSLGGVQWITKYLEDWKIKDTKGFSPVTLKLLCASVGGCSPATCSQQPPQQLLCSLPFRLPVCLRVLLSECTEVVLLQLVWECQGLPLPRARRYCAASLASASIQGERTGVYQHGGHSVCMSPCHCLHTWAFLSFPCPCRSYSCLSVGSCEFVCQLQQTIPWCCTDTKSLFFKSVGAFHVTSGSKGYQILCLRNMCYVLEMLERASQ